MNRSSSMLNRSKLIQILVVEDEKIIAINLKESLETLGYYVPAIVPSAEKAVQTAAELRPDLVLMDIRLKGAMDGIQAAEQIWTTLQIPVIYVTGHSDESTLERAKVTFPFGYILKPVKDRELYAAIEIALQRHERERLLTTVLEDIGDGLIVSDTQGRVMFLNRMAELLTGWQQSEARGRQLTEVFHLIYEDTRQSLGNPAIVAVEEDRVVYLENNILLLTKDGTELPISDSVAPLSNGRGLITGAVIVFRDETRRRRIEERNLTLQRAQLLERQMADLQRMTWLKDDFLSAISTELRTPLSNIRAAVQLLEITLDQQSVLTDKAAPSIYQMLNYLKILRDQCNQELTVVSDLLELQYLEAGSYPLELTSIAVPECITRLVEVFQDQAQRNQQRLHAVLPPDLPLLTSDLAIVTRILTELLTNACKHTPPGGEILVTADRVRTDSMIQIRISNSGIEIPLDELARVFDKFYRIPTGNHWAQDGTGLGLALLKQQVHCLGGTVWADSGLGQTCFIVELPINPRS